MSTLQRYNRVAMSLHWLIAFAIVGNLLLGWWMHEAIEQAEQQALAAQAFQWHKSIGLSILFLSVLRLLWRLTHRPPALPEAMRHWERLAAHGTHIALYSLMLLVPLSGWLYVSAQWRGDAALSVPTLWFGWFEIPHLFGLNELTATQRQWWAEISFLSHERLAQAMMLLLVLHIGAALKHQFIAKDAILQRMLPMRRQGWLLSAAGLLLLFMGMVLLIKTGSSHNDTDTTIRSSADGWQVIAEDSEIGFSGVHAGDAFRGQFVSWQADLQLHPETPAQSRLSAVIDTASARDGDVLHEETLPQAEWFDVSTYPQATFLSSAIQRSMGEERWEIYGTLTIKNQTKRVGPLWLHFAAGQAHLEGDIKVDRADFNLGMESDAKGEWVSREIGIHIRVKATAPR